MYIYKIFKSQEWVDLETAGDTAGAPIDLADGFIHFSTANQAQETADKHFAGVDGLILAAVDANSLGDALKWEVSRGGDKFPHLFARLALKDVVWSESLPLVNGHHKFPARCI